MRRAVVTVCALFFVQVGQSQQVESVPTAIGGIVLQADSGEPLSKVQITLTKVTTTASSGLSTSSIRPPVIPTVITDAAGRFTFERPEPGSYRVSAARNGFVRESYGARFPGAPGTIINLTAGQSLRDITFRLVKTAAVGGRIQYGSGEPAGGIGVELMKISYDTFGQRSLQTVGSARTNDLGEYRVFWVSPGHYYIAVTTNQNVGTVLSANGNILGASSPNEVATVNQPTVYYPGTVDPRLALPIELAPGNDLRSVDVLVPENQPIFSIRGRVLESSTGQPPRAVIMTLVPRDSSVPRMQVSGESSGYDALKGTFEVRDVVPGTYWLRAQTGGTTRMGTTMILDVTRNLEGLVLNLSAGVSVSGRLRVEGQALSASTTRRVSLRPTQYPLTPIQAALRTGGDASASALVNGDGTFELQNVLAGEYGLTVTQMPPGYFVKEAKIGQVDVLSQPWVIEEGSVRGTLEVVLSSNVSQVEGTVVDSRSQRVSGIQVALIPDASRFRKELFISAVTDQEGHFALREVTPGSYRLFAWEYIEANSFLDPEILRRYEQQGISVRVREGEKAALEVKMIPTLPK